MSNALTRRDFLLKSAATAAASAALGGCSQQVGPDGAAAAASRPTGLKKAVYWGMLPDGMSIEDRCKLARDVGFAGVEAPTTPDPAVADQMRAAADKAGIRIHSVMNSDHWKYPLSSADPEVVNKGVACMEASFRNAKAWGADTVLLVPGVVDPKTRYADAYERSRKVIRERLLPPAAKAGVVIGIEEVWNKFLLSPLEFASFVDSFRSRWVRAYFDVGNIVAYGYPQDWIRTLGGRIVKIHVKDFHAGKHQFVPLLEGSIDWKEVRLALREVGYGGWVTAELPGGDEKYLRDVSERMTKIIDGRV